MFGLAKRMVMVTDTANWSGASMSNGTSKWTPYNTETSMFINAYALESEIEAKAESGLLPSVGLRFLSDFLAGLREYDYQQACPYKNPVTGESMRDNCAFNHTGKQPDWIQPNATVVTSGLATAVGAAWPSLVLDISLSRTLGLGSQAQALDPDNQILCKVSIPGWQQKHHRAVLMTPGESGDLEGTISGIPFGARVEFEVVSDGKSLASFSAIADAAFDWQRGQRRDDKALRSMRLSVHGDMTA